MAFVLDASVTACWALGDEEHAIAALSLAKIRTEDALVPELWWYEVRNILIVNERRGRIIEEQTKAFLDALGCLRVRVDSEFRERDVLALARSQGLTVYDAAYLELAHRNKIRLATLDRRLAEAAQHMGVGLVADGELDSADQDPPLGRTDT